MNSKSLMAVTGLVVMLLMLMALPYSRAQSVEENTIKYGRLLHIIDRYYVDTTNVARLTETAIVDMLGKLDPHSVYISKEEVAKMNEPLEGSFEGIGISFNILKDTLVVVTTIPGGPSQKAGLMSGDRIIYIDDELVAGIGLQTSQVTQKLRGEKGTSVRLKVRRGSGSALLDFFIIRDKIPINSLDAAYMLNDDTGYVKLNRFGATTIDEFVKALKLLRESGNVENLILDLRGNGGGYMRAAVELADHFLGGDRLVVYTDGEHDKRRNYSATAKGDFEKGRLIVLIDENSASASEIVAGAVQDWDRGIIVGRRSFGKGLVQQQFPLTDGSVVRLTTAHYYTPSGRGIQKPYDKGIEEYRRDYINRFEHGELFSKDSIRYDEAQVYHTLLHKRAVYGGGGVMPDVFVPVDTSANFGFYNMLIRSNILYSEAVDYIVANRDKWTNQYKNFQQFSEQFEVSEQLVDKMLAEAEKANIEKNEKSVAFARPYIHRQVKALAARDLFGSDDYYYQIVNKDEPVILKTLEILGEAGEYEKLLVNN